MRRRGQQGFTLIELVTTTVLLSIMAVLGAQLILAPIRSFTDVSRRAELVDTADTALQRISREVRSALPNSVRTTPGGGALEFLNTTAGGRYRAFQDTGGIGNVLLNQSVDTFDVLDGIIPGTISPGFSLVLYNTGTGPGDFNAYTGNNVAAITAVNTAVTPNQLSFDGGVGFTFPFPIPPTSQQRFYVVDGPISYVCSGGNLWRYQNYAISIAQPTPVAGAPIGAVNGQLLANNISICQFSFQSGAGSRHGLVTLRVQIADAPTGESVSLLYQAHVVNVP
jgi:MSHA biogenesis protein MshO